LLPIATVFDVEGAQNGAQQFTVPLSYRKFDQHYRQGKCLVLPIARSAYKPIRSTLRNDRLLWALFAATAITTAWKESEIVWLFLLCGLVSMGFKARARIRVAPGAGAMWAIALAITGVGNLWPARWERLRRQ
jgi:hypothetical protein